VNALLRLSIVLLSDSTPTQSELREFSDAFLVDRAIVDGVISIGQKNFEGISAFGERFGSCQRKEAESLVTLIENLRTILPRGRDSASRSLTSKVQSASSEDSVEKAVADLAPKQIFGLIDKDKSGDVDFNEFLDLLKYLRFDMSENQALKIFAQSAKADGFLSPDNFEIAIDKLNDLVCHRALQYMDLSTTDLTLKLLFRFFVLIALYLFIFIGLSALATSSPLTSASSIFGSLSTTVLVIVAVWGAGLGVEFPEKDEEAELAKEAIQRVLESLKRSV